ncbi:hypothetical protein KQH61_00490 [bacterium]|nr:hypothetical protein [bacterium]
MDGVLLEAQGYHRALQETVRLAGEALSLEDIRLSQAHINRFESLGISSEWHSSALCMAFLKIQLLSGVNKPTLDLESLFIELEHQPLALPAVDRGRSAIKRLCEDHNIDPTNMVSIIANSEDMDNSITMQWFQELVLGTESYQKRYNKQGRFNTQSYLKMFDNPLISPKNAEMITHWVNSNNGQAAIMTNRPSIGPKKHFGSPEAELGLDLVKLDSLSLTGYGEISWLAENIRVTPATLVKPNPTHALAAIAGSFHIEEEESLRISTLDPAQWPDDLLTKLHKGSISVIEDTPAGLVSVLNAGEALMKAGVEVDVRPLGIAKERTKQAALEAYGAQVFPEINAALSALDYF